ncbi:hypothetical protein HII28_14185 [Planctomonas sp. JC2975]|uniref:hypothetical protein n=1 Tax=Planctomonas sp. JC2975 TaxID=2729626 RepID=UPI0014760370|nr:hypothetical protein [Planctomonas sp. JC2975]NNC13020.1 hypothetical protein [Planctomonas sp. JC2975]
MRSHDPLPLHLGTEFSAGQAMAAGVSRKRIRSEDLARPFYGARSLASWQQSAAAQPTDPFERQRMHRVTRARQYAPLLRPTHFFSHETAAALYGAPLPLLFDDAGVVEELDQLDLHVSVLGRGAIPRTSGIVHHRAQPSMTVVRQVKGMPVSSAASTWASLGMLPLSDLIALGDYFARRWRAGVGRRSAGRPPLASIDQLRRALDAGRRIGAPNLREALAHIREDSWSPRESALRYLLVQGGLPEPELNVDLFDSKGAFPGCVDMLYREQHVIVEYLGMLHGASWARDVERLAALRAAGWVVIEVTAPLLAHPVELVRRVRAALTR